MRSGVGVNYGGMENNRAGARVEALGNRNSLKVQWTYGAWQKTFSGHQKLNYGDRRQDKCSTYPSFWEI